MYRSDRLAGLQMYRDRTLELCHREQRAVIYKLHVFINHVSIHNVNIKQLLSVVYPTTVCFYVCMF